MFEEVTPNFMGLMENSESLN